MLEDNKNNTQAQAFVTFSNLLEGFMNTSKAKLATLLFDTIFFENFFDSKVIINAPSFAEWKEAILTKNEHNIDSDTIKYLVNRWQGIELNREVMGTLQSGELLTPELNAEIDTLVGSEVVKYLINQKVHPIEIGKEAVAAKFNLRHIFSRWLSLPGNVALLGGELEKSLLLRISKPLPSSQLETATSLLSLRIADFSDLTWSNIAELCHHSYYDSFRKKVAELTYLRSECLITEASSLAKEIFENSLLELAQLVRPQPRWTIFKAILGNLPIASLIINPISIISGISDLKKEFKIKAEHAWIYFMIDLGLISPKSGKPQK